jgi:hypothetical protein
LTKYKNYVIIKKLLKPNPWLQLFIMKKIILGALALSMALG